MFNYFFAFLFPPVPVLAYFSYQKKRAIPLQSAVKTSFFIDITLLVLYALYAARTGGFQIVWLLAQMGERISVKFLLAALAFDGFIILLHLLSGKLNFSVYFHPERPNTGKTLFLVLLFIVLLVSNTISFFKNFFQTVSMEQLVFHLFMPMEGVNLSPGLVNNYFRSVFDFPLLIPLTIYLISSVSLGFHGRGNVGLDLIFKNKYISLLPFLVLFSLSLVSLFRSGLAVQIVKYFESPSTFYEENYIEPKDLHFVPSTGKNRNLLVIFVESLETWFLSRDQGGAMDKELINEVHELAQNNINFSQGGKVGGEQQVYGTSWTIGGMVANYTGVPLVLLNDGNTMYLLHDFMPNLRGVGDILHDLGYKNYFILGSDVQYAGRGTFFRTHGDTTIYDFLYFKENGYIPQDYSVWWGLEDRKLYSFAKEKIREMSRDAEPFFATILTADTHFSGGYLDEIAERKYEDQFENVLLDMSRQLDEFISWIKAQDFYENTTVVILGDHLYMDSSFFPPDADWNNRRPLNIFINSLLEEDHSKNREFTHFDIFPTLIDSIGIDYDAPGLGLGRSMARGEPTLVESLGSSLFGEGISRKSRKYNSFFRGR
jgi:phosphoglycerol transferase